MFKTPCLAGRTVIKAMIDWLLKFRLGVVHNTLRSESLPELDEIIIIACPLMYIRVIFTMTFHLYQEMNRTHILLSSAFIREIEAEQKSLNNSINEKNRLNRCLSSVYL